MKNHQMTTLEKVWSEQKRHETVWELEGVFVDHSSSKPLRICRAMRATDEFEEAVFALQTENSKLWNLVHGEGKRVTRHFFLQIAGYERGVLSIENLAEPNFVVQLLSMVGGKPTAGGFSEAWCHRIQSEHVWVKDATTIVVAPPKSLAGRWFGKGHCHRKAMNEILKPFGLRLWIQPRDEEE